MKTIKQLLHVILLGLFLNPTASTQNTKGLKPTTEDGLVTKTGIIRAVVVGVSEYKDEGIPDLKYAHIDAQAFTNYLKSEAGGQINPDNIKSYFNEEATGGNVHQALNWLVNETQEGDLCIIYFSGHGDVETIYEEEPGHFLVHDSPSTIYQINSLRVADLNNIINTLSVKKNAQVHVYTDACRSGKLAGSEIKGSQATAAALNKQFANEIKIMSCQANEYSLENEKWGGGRGIFSYHLLEGMTGLADSDEDKIITLKEIQRYLEDEVSLSLNGQRQTPISLGDRYAKIALVDEASLIALRDLKNLGTDQLLTVQEIKPTNIKTNEQILIDFYKALEEDNLLLVSEQNQSTVSSAEKLFESIQADAIHKDRLPILKGDFIAQLQDDAQLAINKYLSLDHEEMKRRWANEVPEDFDKYARYLEKAASLMDNYHYLYPQIKAKQIYFEVLAKRIELEIKGANPEAYASLYKKLQEALVFEKRAPFIHNELGWISVLEGEYERAIKEFEVAIEMSPQWALPYNNISFVHNRLNQADQAIEFATTAVNIKEDFISPYYNLSRAHASKKEFSEAIKFDLSYLKLYPEDCIMLNNLGYHYYLNNEEQKAIEYYDHCITCNAQYASCYINKAILLDEMGNIEAALNTLILGEKAKIDTPNFNFQLGYYYSKNKKCDLAKEQFEKVLEVKPNHLSRKYLAINYLKCGQFKRAIQEFEAYLNHVNAIDTEVFFFLACSYANIDDLNQFEKYMIKAIDATDQSKELIKKMEDSNLLSSIRSTMEYQNILSRL